MADETVKPIGFSARSDTKAVFARHREAPEHRKLAVVLYGIVFASFSHAIGRTVSFDFDGGRHGRKMVE